MVKYKLPSLAVDTIVHRGDKILLIRRGRRPFQGRLAFPGGFVEYGDTVEATALREVKEETGLVVRLEDVLGVYSDPKRDPRKHTVTIFFIASPLRGRPRGGDDARAAAWLDTSEIRRQDLAFDHWKVLQDYLKWKKSGGTFWSSR